METFGTVATQAESYLTNAGLDADAVSLVIEHLVPVSYLETTGAEVWLSLIELAGAYIARTAAHKFQDRKVDIALVSPVFENPDLTDQYLVATILLHSAQSETKRTLGTANRRAQTQLIDMDYRAQEWLRSVHRALIQRDFLMLGPLAALAEVSTLALYLQNPSYLLNVQPQIPFDDIDWETFQSEIQGADRQNTALSAPLSPHELISQFTGTDLFVSLDEALEILETDLRATGDLDNKERRSHQLTSLTTEIVRHMLSIGLGRSFNLIIELDAPPAVGRRMMAEYPLISGKTLEALRHTLPLAFRSIRRPSDINKSDLYRQWERMTLGQAEAGFAREAGVLGLLAEAARASIELLLNRRVTPS